MTIIQADPRPYVTSQLMYPSAAQGRHPRPTHPYLTTSVLHAANYETLTERLKVETVNEA